MSSELEILRLENAALKRELSMYKEARRYGGRGGDMPSEKQLATLSNRFGTISENQAAEFARLGARV
jgi:hypothetical protein